MAELKKTYYLSGNLYATFFEINGLKEGEYNQYWESGNLFENCNYVNGKKMVN